MRAFVSWTKENGRTRDLAKALNLAPVHVHSPGPGGLPGRYLRQYRQTVSWVAEHDLEALGLMLPPTPALMAVTASASNTLPKIFDLHTGFFYDPKWRWAHRLSLRRMRDQGIAIVTNTHLQQICEAHGVRSIVLHDVIEDHTPPNSYGAYLVCPVSYANDEPIDEMLEAARLTPTVEWKFSGKAPASIRSSAPDNVTFTGFVPDAEYGAMITGAMGVVALTTRPHTMQRAGYEAFNAGIPHITSNFPELRDFYSDSAVYTEPSAHRIAEAVNTLGRTRDALAEQLLHVRKRRIEEQAEALARIRKHLSGNV